MDATFSYRTSARGHDCGYRDSLVPLSLLNYLQDAAYGHSIALGISVYDLFRKGLTWVLSRYHLVIDRYPRIGEEFEVRTWTCGRLRRHYLREFEVTDADGAVIVRATSAWLMMNLRNRRPVDTAGDWADLPLLERRALDDDFQPIAAAGEGGETFRFPVRLSEVDLNRHVNHVHVIQWAIESVPLAIHERSVPSEIEIAYLGEARYGDTAVVRTIPPGDGAPFLHHISRESDGAALAVARVHWAPS